MKKLLINCLLILVFIALIVAVWMGLSRLRDVDTSDAKMNSLLEGQEQDVADEKAVQEQATVKVSVIDTSADKTNTSKSTTISKTTSSSQSADGDIDNFLSEID